jgi:hypothetical protein
MMATEFVVIVIDALNRLNIPYMLVGSFSSNIYGTPRSTKDADFVVQLDHRLLGPLAAIVGQDFEFEPQMTFETVTSTMRYRMRHKGTAFLVELFELSGDAHDQTRFARRLEMPFAGRTAFVPTAEDVVITKLRWSKQGQRSKDVDDVRNVLAAQHPSLDLPYVRNWCDQHGTRDLFERLFAQVAAQP